ncbi:MAG: hypothetical protein PUI84_05890 [Bacteroidales bacterium]|nr:hypothetical protein [Porphyromonas sp.]MDD6934832.1 hypothetical protein [Bacteroidales bacterium]MDY3102197.1 hypothetical protein [Porphyromonas sp.]
MKRSNSFAVALQHFCLILFVFLSLFACQSNSPKEQDLVGEDRGELIYSRQGDAPIILSKDIDDRDENSLRSNSSDPLKQYIGFAYNPAEGLLGNPACFKRQIFDIRRFEEDSPRSIEKLPLKRLVSECSTFASEKSFSSNISRKYSNVFSVGVDFKIFKIGYEQTFSSSFNNTFEFKEKTAYAELNVLCQEERETLERSADLDNLISNKYMSDVFRSNLYNKPFQDLFSMDGRYAPVVITQYVSGGKAIFLYHASSKEVHSSTKLESELRDKIETSCTITGNSFSMTPSAKNSNGGSNSSSTSTTNFFETLRVVYETRGGGYAMGFSAPMKYDQLKMDFSPWVNSLNDKSTHVLIDIPKGGFTPISEFVQEENFKKRIEQRAYNKSFREPYLEIRLGSPDKESDTYETQPEFPYRAPRPLYLFLHTRYGDQISLRPIHESDNSFWQAQYEEEYNRKVKKIADYAHGYYNLDIRKTFHYSVWEDLMPYSRKKSPSSILRVKFSNDIVLDLFGLKEGQLKRCKHPYYYNEAKGQFMQYLYFVEGNKRYAFAIYDPYILDTYGIRDLFNKAKEEPLSIHDLKNFRIIGL